MAVKVSRKHRRCHLIGLPTCRGICGPIDSIPYQLSSTSISVVTQSFPVCHALVFVCPFSLVLFMCLTDTSITISIFPSFI
ncbi:hypothetical protein BKA82DRAFT_379002 [Pisolithus tinctorius]|uniref:Uncharacterized protein n=1 Tax=Pisolithus tinctorius Marx 270 TaxID=870435 RepID=A0A0C3JGB7_PISTI|nr:hypothetical protein BKA82DRAFT_379002 [Pisolithus tinctorius]KIO08113.1 hypothetical protein M404DRAFT_379002 [Pisolithus tinctorius Marx 270]